MSSTFRVLIIDDDPMNIEIMREILEEKYDLAYSDNCIVGLSMLPKFNPDLILLDIMMPKMDGYECIKRIREDDKFRFVKIICVSGKIMLEDRLKGYHYGADDYITKPFMQEELLAKVEVFLRLKRVEEVNNMKDDVLKIIAHETRTPLNGIIGIAQLLKEDDSLNGEIKKKVDIIVKSGYRLLELFKKTEFLFAMKNGVNLEKREDKLFNHVKAIIQLFEKEAEKKAVKFEIAVEEGITCRVDWTIFEPVLKYVIENAVKFSPEGGTVTIFAGIEDEQCIVKIEDEGKGVDEQWESNIFDMFAVKDVIHHHKGSGLSLAISKRAMEIHGGTIELGESTGKGAQFILRLPK